MSSAFTCLHGESGVGRAPEHHNWGYSWLLSFCPSYTSPPCPLHSLNNFSCSSLDPGAHPQPLCLSPPGVQPTPCPNSTLGFDLPSAGSTSVTSTAGDKGGGDPGAAASAPAGEREFQVRQVWPGCSAHPCWPWQPQPRAQLAQTPRRGCPGGLGEPSRRVPGTRPLCWASVGPVGPLCPAAGLGWAPQQEKGTGQGTGHGTSFPVLTDC